MKFAHKVEIAEDVGATLHIEPNDNPMAGEPARLWFALTRVGGTVLPLAKCKCELKIYKNSQVILEPTLAPWSAEGYQDIPSAIATFPEVGKYKLEISGKPQNGVDFQPFKLNFAITVATAKPTASKPVEQPRADNPSSVDNTNNFGAIAPGLVVITIAVAGVWATRLFRKS